MVCVCVGGGSCQQSLSDCIVCAHYSVSMCRHTYVNQRRVHDSCCYKHTPHSCRLHVHKHSAHSTLVESPTQLSSALYTQIPFAVQRFINNYNIPDWRHYRAQCVSTCSACILCVGGTVDCQWQKCNEPATTHICSWPLHTDCIGWTHYSYNQVQVDTL